MLAKVLKPFFWYTDNRKITKSRDQQRIILQVLNYGDRKATKWLFKNYDQAIIKQVIINFGNELDKKSLNYWCQRLNIKSLQFKRTRL